MKHTTRILALLLALVLCLGLSVTAFATEGNTPTGNGSITINGAVKDQTFWSWRAITRHLGLMLIRQLISGNRSWRLKQSM